MTREEKCKLAIEKGFTYDPISGAIFNSKGKELDPNNTTKRKNIGFRIKGFKPSITITAHQFAYYYTYGECGEYIDHKDGNPNNNRLNNLRSVTQQENTFNSHKTKGYTWCKKAKKWKAKIMLNGKTINLGHYDNEHDARQAYLDAKKVYHIIPI